MNTIRKNATMLLSAAILMMVQCTTNEQAGIEITSGSSCTGTIYNKDATVAAGAVVRLIPAGYDPSNPASGIVDSTVTDGKGRYSFTVAQTDFFNIIAEKGSQSCMQDSVPILADAGKTLDNDTLDEPGYLAGFLSVKPGTDPRHAVLLLPGTEWYTAPVDSLGTLAALRLSSGRFSVKAFTTDNGYLIFDTTITIRPRDTTWLSVQLPTSYAPAVKAFTLTFDTASLGATLSWSPADTAQFNSYALHRMVNGADDTIILIDKTASSYFEDCLGYFEDTVSYAIAAVGKNYKEGYLQKAAPLIVTGKASSMTKTVLSKWGGEYVDLCVNSNGELFFFGADDLLKIDDSGNVVKKVSSAILTKSQNAQNHSVMTDTLGNIYAYIIEDGKGFIEKLDHNLGPIAEFEIPDRLICSAPNQQCPYNPADRIAVGDDGSLYLHSYCDDTISHATKITVFNPDFSLKNTFTIDRPVKIWRSHGDTLIATSLKQPECDPSSLQIVTLFDRSFNVISSFETVDALAPYRNATGSEKPSFANLDVFSTNIYICESWTVTYSRDKLNHVSTAGKVLAVYDRNGELLGRYLVPLGVSTYFRSGNCLYMFNRLEAQTIYRFSLEKLIEY